MSLYRQKAATRNAKFITYICMGISRSMPYFLQVLLCRLGSIAEHRDHFVRRLCVCVCLSCSPTFLALAHSYILQATHAFLGMLPLCFVQVFKCVMLLMEPKDTALFKNQGHRGGHGILLCKS